MARHIKPSEIELLHKGSLITFIHPITKDETCLGDLMHFEGRGTYDPSIGLVDVTKEEADLHNAALDKASIEGMDKQCQIGQGAHAYFYPDTAKGHSVTTFSGTVIASGAAVILSGRNVRFYRGNREFRGRLPKDGSAFNFRRFK